MGIVALPLQGGMIRGGSSSSSSGLGAGRHAIVVPPLQRGPFRWRRATLALSVQRRYFPTLSLVIRFPTAVDLPRPFSHGQPKGARRCVSPPSQDFSPLHWQGSPLWRWPLVESPT